MFAVFVKPGDAVRKGQLLGHLELDATKLQLDLAKQALDSKSNIEAAEGHAEARRGMAGITRGNRGGRAAPQAEGNEIRCADAANAG
jgi:multidrug efflux pump subunit AcrA (membrane-fusion protein)